MDLTEVIKYIKALLKIREREKSAIKADENVEPN
jgi:hypothetical protein